MSSSPAFRSLLATLLLSACQSAPLLSLPSPVQIQQTSHSSPWQTFLQEHYNHLFEEQDLNHNGWLEAQEVPHLSQSLKRQDLNQDGRLSPAEARPDSTFLRQQALWLEQEFKQAAQPHPTAAEDPGLDLPQNQDFEAFTQTFLNQVERLRKQATQPQQSTGRIPVLLVPGYAEPSWYFMYGIYRNLVKAGWPVEGINLFPNFASAQEQAAKVKAKVEAMMKKYGSPRINLVVHSFGGLISRYYIQELGGSQVVENLVTVATPHLGTYTAYLGPGESAVQLRPESEFIRQLNAQGFTRPPVRYTSIWSNLDEIVIPQKNAIMPDSSVHYVPWTGHLTIMFSQRTYGHIRQALEPPLNPLEAAQLLP